MIDAVIRQVVEEALRPDQFFLNSGLRIHLVHLPRELISWELYNGHLLDRTQTRETREFDAWNVVLTSSGDTSMLGPTQDNPLLSVWYDSHARKLFVTRSILVYGHEAFESQPNVIESREALKWSTELVGTIDLDLAGTPEALAGKLRQALYLAVVGTSRLAITSLESPLPAFALGQLAYIPRQQPSPSKPQPIESLHKLVKEVLSRALPIEVQARILETILRSATHDEMPALVVALIGRWRTLGNPPGELSALLKTLFHQIVLSPYTVFATNLLALLDQLAAPAGLGTVETLDLISYFLRHLARHLTAFDLVTFHNRGANYPDALSLDGLLKLYLRLIQNDPCNLFSSANDSDDLQRVKRFRRRALRQAWILRKQCEGLAVPDAPSSVGEVRRVLPAPWPRVSEQQIDDVTSRRRRLFTDEPTESLASGRAAEILAASIDDLHHPRELRELGMATFLDRPLGIYKQPGEVDRTALMSYEAWSRQIAERRLTELAPDRRFHQPFTDLSPPGLAVKRFGPSLRPGVVALEDAAIAAVDFIFLRSTRRSLDDLLAQYDFSRLAACEPDAANWLATSRDILLIRSPDAASGGPLLRAWDRQMRLRLELIALHENLGIVPYNEVAACEWLENGLLVRPSERESASVVALPRYNNLWP